MPKIAIIKISDNYDTSDYESNEQIIRSISDWDEVDDDELQTLKKAFNYTNLKVVERVELTPELKENTVKAYLKTLKKRQEEIDKYNKEQAEKALIRKKKRDEKKALKEKEEYERLKSKFE